MNNTSSKGTVFALMSENVGGLELEGGNNLGVSEKMERGLVTAVSSFYSDRELKSVRLPFKVHDREDGFLACLSRNHLFILYDLEIQKESYHVELEKRKQQLKIPNIVSMEAHGIVDGVGYILVEHSQPDIERTVLERIV
jgi:hypothetical protein